jgi:hypothetical protein
MQPQIIKEPPPNFTLGYAWLRSLGDIVKMLRKMQVDVEDIM